MLTRIKLKGLQYLFSLLSIVYMYFIFMMSRSVGNMILSLTGIISSLVLLVITIVANLKIHNEIRNRSSDIFIFYFIIYMFLIVVDGLFIKTDSINMIMFIIAVGLSVLMTLVYVLDTKVYTEFVERRHTDEDNR